MRFWDSSAIVPLLVTEPGTAVSLRLYESDPEMVVWWGTPVECVSAVARHEREATLSAAGVAAALERLDALQLAWHEVQPVEPVRRLAIRLLRVHPLRTADALQLAAGLAAAEGRPETIDFVTLDERLALVARREGCAVVGATGQG